MKSIQKKKLRVLAHHLKPVVITGQAGLTPAVLNEIDQALEHHELIKVRANAEDREARARMSAQICMELNAELVQAIGHVITLYRKTNKSPAS